VIFPHVPNGNGSLAIPAPPEARHPDASSTSETSESSDGSFDIYDEGEEVGDAYVFVVAGAPAEGLLRVAADVAALPGVPPGAFAAITDEQSEEIGTGRRVALS
jgi:hypothetical protein